jgi:hypothetical protein
MIGRLVADVEVAGFDAAAFLVAARHDAWRMPVVSSVRSTG